MKLTQGCCEDSNATPPPPPPTPPPLTCPVHGETCSNSDPCCGCSDLGLTYSGSCLDCGSSNTCCMPPAWIGAPGTCTQDSHCCNHQTSGYKCEGGSCCSPPGRDCKDDGNCCGSGTCYKSPPSAIIGQCCSGRQGSCAANFECCGTREAGGSESRSIAGYCVSNKCCSPVTYACNTDSDCCSNNPPMTCDTSNPITTALPSASLGRCKIN